MNIFTTANGGSYLLIKSLTKSRVSRWRSVRRALLVTGLLAALLFPLTAKGERDTRSFDLLAPDKAAHMGVSYAIHTFSYGFYHKAFQMPRLQSHIFAAANTIFAGLVWEMMGNMDPNDLLADGLGMGGAMITIEAFDF